MTLSTLRTPVPVLTSRRRTTDTQKDSHPACHSWELACVCPRKLKSSITPFSSKAPDEPASHRRPPAVITVNHRWQYAGLAPTTRSSGTSIHGEHAPRGGNRQLKRAMFLSAFAALHDPASRTYYDRCRARGKTHTQALLRLARQRINVLFAMLRDSTFYEPRTPRTA